MADSLIESLNWKGTIPIHFHLAPEEVTSFKPPLPLYLMVSRQSYLQSPALTDLIHAHFQRHAPINDPRLWFEDESATPLRWSFPVGVLFDSLGYSGTYEKLPWKIIVHYQGFPDKEIIPFANIEDVKATFQNTFKEASFLKFGSVQPVGKLEKEEWETLWDAVVHSRGEEVRRIHQHVENLAKGIRSYAIRVMYNGIEDKHVFRVIRKPVKLEDADSEEGDDITLGMILEQFVPESGPSDVVIQGIRPPLDTPIRWLTRTLYSSDSFLYISVVETDEKEEKEDELDDIFDFVDDEDVEENGGSGAEEHDDAVEEKQDIDV